MITSRTHDRHCYLIAGMRDALVESSLFDLAELMNLTLLAALVTRDEARLESSQLNDAVRYGYGDQ